MENYILKLNSGTEYKLYKGTTLVSDADLTTLFGVAGEMYLSFDFNSGTPSDLTTFTITDSSDIAVISNSNLTDTVAEGKNYKATWSSSATTFDTFEELEGKALDESQLSFLMGKIKDAGGLKVKYITEYIPSPSSSTQIRLDQIIPTLDEGVYVFVSDTVWQQNISYGGSQRIAAIQGWQNFLLIVHPKNMDATGNAYTYSADFSYKGGLSLVFKRANLSSWAVETQPAITNNLTTQYTGTALDASQGKILADRIGVMSNLTTTDKTSVVNAINELNADLDSASYIATTLSTLSNQAYVGTANIFDGAVTTAKLAGPKIIECGTLNVGAISAGRYATVTKSFDTAFDDTSYLAIATPSDAYTSASVTNKTIANVTFAVVNNGSGDVSDITLDYVIIE